MDDLSPLLISQQTGGEWMRLDVAAVLKRFFFLEQALVLASAGWIPALQRLDSKATLAKVTWQGALTADALRERVFELRYPSRLLEVAEDEALVTVFRAVLHAPNPIGVVEALSDLLLPTLHDAYRRYLQVSDALADGPTHRILTIALHDKDEQIGALRALLNHEPASSTEREVGRRWRAELERLLSTLGGVWPDQAHVDVEVPRVVEPGREFRLAQDPGRDDAYFLCRFYWPDIVDQAYPYGEGLALQLRSAISHLNEVWAVDTAGAVLQGLAEPLGWEFIRDAARWLYDESRHMTMGKRRLEAWGLPPSEIPLGTYIYEAARDQEPIYRLGMLGYFETKNIGKKQERARSFEVMGDRRSQQDMDFDWADETLHAEYGRRWLKRLLEREGRSREDWQLVLARCEQLVREEVASATAEERATIRAVADHLLKRARRLANAGAA
jgi:uncharacterized ferritin-like protein (DUF455 family)